MIYKFERYELDTGRAELRCNRTVQRVEPQVFDVLCFLIENRHRVVTKAELHDAIWADQTVSDWALSSRIKSARQAIGDSGRRQQWICTLQKKGFRFIGEVEVTSDVPLLSVRSMAESTPATSLMSEPPSSTTEPALDRHSIVVLPFTQSGDTAEDRHVLADGLVQDIINRLGRTRWLSVTARGTAFRYRNRMVDPLTVADQLGVRYVTHGSVQLNQGKMRAHVVLVDASSGHEIWAECFDRRLDDIFAIQEEIADAVAGAVRTEVQLREQKRSLLKPPESLDAWEAYHLGCWHLFRFRAVNVSQAERFFQQSAKLDPSASAPHTGLSFVHWQRAFLGLNSDPEGEIQQAFDYASHSLFLDPHDPDGHCALGRAFQLRGELDASMDALEAAVDLNPSSVLSLYSLSRSLLFKGESTRCDQLASRARQLSPFDPMTFAIASVQSLICLRLDRYDDAVRLAEISATQPNAHFNILAIAAVVHAQAGRVNKAAQYLSRLHEVHPTYGPEDYLRAFPFQDAHDINHVQTAFAKLIH